MTDRHDTETRLAELADGGVIVEVGCGVGNGLRALWGGTQHGRLLPIYAIDPYADYTDGLGAHYGPDSERQMKVTVASLLGEKIFQVRQGGVEAAESWGLPVALCWLDLSMPADKLIDMVMAWHPHIVPGGYLAITGLSYAQLGTAAAADYLASTGDYDRAMTDQGEVAVFQRREAGRRGVFYIVGGDDKEKYARQANKSAGSVKRWMPGRANGRMETFLYAAGGCDLDLPNIDHVYTLPHRTSALWYLDSTRYFNQVVNERTDYAELLYLDTDTWVCSDCMDLWATLSHFDIAVGQAAGRDATPSAYGVPPAFTTPSIGVTLFNNNERVRAMMGEWLDNFECYQTIYGDYDEAALRDTLYFNRQGLRVYTLPPEYTARVGFGGWYFGKVRILHAQLDNLPEIAEEINSTTAMRIWRYGWLWRHGVNQ